MGLKLTINLDLTIFSRETKHIVKSRSYCTNYSKFILIMGSYFLDDQVKSQLAMKEK